MTARNALTDDLHRFHDEARGVLYLTVLPIEDVADLAIEAMSGDAEAVELADLASKAVAKVMSAPRAKPALCGSCPRPIRREKPFTIGIARPGCDDATKAIALTLCRRCAVDGSSAIAAAGVALRRIWPGLRRVAVHAGDRGVVH